MTENLVLERISRSQWDMLAANFGDLSYRQCSSYAEEAARRVGAVSELTRIITPDQCLVGLAEVRVKSAPIVPWGLAYVSYAPLTMLDDRFSEQDFDRCVDALSREYVGRRGFVLRMVPPPSGGLFQRTQASCLENRGFRPGLPRPTSTFLLDLARPLGAIRHDLNPKWRSSLIKAERAGIKITRSVKLNDFDAFNVLFVECAKRKKFLPDQDMNFFKCVQVRAPLDQKLVLHLAWYNDELVAGHLGSYVGNTAFYLLGAASPTGRRLHASFLLQWNVIKYAQAVGNTFYDLGGVDEKENPGVYRFKRRLGGRPFTELGPYELARGGVSSGVVRLAEVARTIVKHGLKSRPVGRAE